jgi:hypothetical protein
MRSGTINIFHATQQRRQKASLLLGCSMGWVALLKKKQKKGS